MYSSCSVDEWLDYVAINQSTGELSLRHEKVLDYEKTKAIDCTIMANDSDLYFPRFATLQVQPILWQ